VADSKKSWVPNGTARIARKTRWAGIATKFGHDPSEERVSTSRVKITAKLISTPFDRYDRATGRDRTAKSYGIKPRRVVAYQLDGQEWVEVQP
jgi:hypothetical protein